jgi:hypothetical protein
MTVHDQTIFFVQGAKKLRTRSISTMNHFESFLFHYIYTNHNATFTFVTYNFFVFIVLMSTVKLRNGVTQTYPHPITHTSCYAAPFSLLP